MYVVSLKQFDGPLDLLLTLVTRAKIDIREIFVSEITEQYMQFMAGLDELDMDSASEFLQMASLLLEIKSRALLPTPPKAPEDGSETPEQALIRQLTEYKAFKQASEDLKKLEEAARALLTKLPEEYPLPPPTYELTGLSLDGLAKAFQRALQRALEKGRSEERAQREIRAEAYTIQSCMLRVQSRLKRGSVVFSSLFSPHAEREEIITVFLALLELLRLNRVCVEQLASFDEILIHPVRRFSQAKDSAT